MLRPDLLFFLLVALITVPLAGAEPAKSDWKKLPAKTDGPWEPCNFGGDGEVKIADGLIQLGFGDPLTGVRLTSEFPKENFEIELEARRTSGYDFFCGLTFPVGESHCSFILGGWGGGVVGLSSIDRMDASQNETTAYKIFDNGKWFKVRVRVSKQQVEAWINDKVFAEVPRKDREFSIRVEMDPTVPVGIACYQCTAEIRNVRWRPLPAKGEQQGDAKQADGEQAEEAATSQGSSGPDA